MVTTPEERESSGSAASRVQRRRERHRTRMLDIAEEMFATQPFSTVRIDELAERADLSVGTVYTHFGSKNGVFEAAAERGLDRVENNVADAMNAAGDDPIGRLMATGQAYLELLIESPSLARFLLTPSLPDSDEIAADVRKRIAAVYEALTAAVQSCIDSGDIEPIDARRLATFLISAWAGTLIATSSPLAPPIDNNDARATIEQAAMIVLRGLLRRGDDTRS